MKKALKHESSDPTHKPVTMGTDVKAMYKVALFEGLVLINISENFYYLPQKCLLMMWPFFFNCILCKIAQ